MFCNEASLVNLGDGKWRAVTLRCRSWLCDMCSPLRKSGLIREIMDGCPTKLITLTTRRVEGGDPNIEARRQQVAFRLFVRFIRKTWPSEEFAYYAVREATKVGWPHIHLLIRSPYMDHRSLKAEWTRLTGSWGVHITKVPKGKSGANYMAKYLGKDCHRFDSLKRYWHSKNWFDVRPARQRRDGSWDRDWTIVRRKVGELALEKWMQGYIFSLTGEFGFFEARAPP